MPVKRSEVRSLLSLWVASTAAAVLVACGGTSTRSDIGQVSQGVGVVALINAGSDAAYVDTQARTWDADRNFTGGSIARRGAIEIGNTNDDAVYQSERYGMTGYSIPTISGTYIVKLHFAETFSGITGAGQRVFHVNVEGQQLQNLDVYAETGGRNRALVKTFNGVNVTDGTLNITFTQVTQNSMINGIEILTDDPGGAVSRGYTTETTQTARFDQSGDHFHQVWTHTDGTIYFTWIDDSNRWMVGRKATSGQTSTTVLMTGVAENEFHHIPSIAVDKNGYIHAIGPMHHDNWLYRVSVNPNDIGTFVDGMGTSRALPSGIVVSGKNWITYPNFAKDNDDDLYIAFRLRVGRGGWVPGVMAGGMARYDAANLRWIELGGTNYTHSTRCLLWANTAMQNSGYQGYNLHPSFDANGRLHLAWTLNVNGTDSSWKEEVHYVYSDDKGATWRTADGALVPQLPIQPSASTRVRNVAAEGRKVYAYSGAFRRSDGRPVVSYSLRSEEGGPQYSYWDGQKWVHNSLGADFPGRLLIDSHGVWTRFDNSGLWTSTDSGVTWKRYNQSLGHAQNMNVDMSFFKDTNIIRFISFRRASQDNKNPSPWSVITFVSDERRAP